MKNQRIASAMVSHPGLIRSENEDSAYVDNELPLFMVADGMGGLEKGAIAAELSIKTAAEYFKKSIKDMKNSVDVQRTFIEAFSTANIAIREYALANGIQMGTTLTGVFLTESRLVCCHAGDSPIFLIRRNKLTQITVNHNCGEGKEHIVTKYLGGNGEIKPDINVVTVKAYDQILVTTDGVSNFVDQYFISNILKLRISVSDKVQLILGCALGAGAPDNVSAILITVPDTQWNIKDHVMKIKHFLKRRILC